MRIKRLRIGSWRHFSGIELKIPEGSPLVCLVGGNGTGKSQILEMIGSAAQKIGISPGYANNRGDAFSESSDVEIVFQIAPDVFPEVEKSERFGGNLQGALQSWDRTITLSMSPQDGFHMRAGAIPEPGLSRQFSEHAATLIRESTHVHYLMLDADRAYPRMAVQVHQMGEAFNTNWQAQTKSSSFTLTKNLYEEWFRYLLGTESQENNRYVQSIRLARERQEPEPPFIDKMAGYRDSIHSVLPHLVFTGIDPSSSQILFDSTGIPLQFHQLSGGEREIAFLTGQIERFGLRRGLLLVDEPELHLNNDLLRKWIRFLKNTVEQGQIWLASHSIEVVEVTGQASTFVLERNPTTGKVLNAKPIGERPVLATLSRALGSPAFSVSNLSFVYVEGEETIGERERFQLLCSDIPDVRFLEGGNCRNVIQKVTGLRDLSRASGEQLRAGGIVDRDHRPPAEVERLRAEGVYVLDVHEVENLFLHPESVRAAMRAIS